MESFWSQEYSLQWRRTLQYARGTTAHPEMCLLAPRLHEIDDRP